MNAATFASLLETQAHYCRVIGSPLYAHLLQRAGDDVREGGPVLDLLRGHEHDEPSSMLALRLLGAVHRAVLRGDAPELAPFYPSVGGEADPERAWPAFRGVVARLREPLRDELKAPVQTNEVGRSAAQLGGFLLVAEATGFPLRVLEVGASAGLILRWDRYIYASGRKSWGDSGSAVRFRDFIEGDSFPWGASASVVERRGCDAAPLDATSAPDALTLKSFVWPDQSERFELLDAALVMARAEPVAVECADAAEWAERMLARPGSGVATVLFHSLVLHFLSDETRERLLSVIAEAGERASDDAPLAWLRMELGGDEADVRLTTWPGGDEKLIARAGYHGRPVRWLGA